MGYLQGMVFSAGGHKVEIIDLVSGGEFATSYRVKWDGQNALLKQYNNPARGHTSWYDAYVTYQGEVINRVNSAPIAPRSIRILDTFAHQGKYHQIHEWLEGITLREALRNPTLLKNPDNLRAAIRGFVKGVKAVHAAGIIHSDLKPENAMLARGNPDDVRIIDFDWGILNGSGFPWDGKARGTPGYFSYEWMKDRSVDYSSDIFSVGLIVYEMITGQHPYDSAFPGPFNDVNHLVRTYVRLVEQRYYQNVETLGSQLGGTPLNNALRSCLDPDPRARPDFDTVLTALESRGAAGTLALKHANGFILKFTADQVQSGDCWFGRERCRMWPDYQFISSHQADFYIDDKAGHWYVTPPRSGRTPKNSTFVNGQPISGPVQINGGEVLEIGNPTTGNKVLVLSVELGI